MNTPDPSRVDPSITRRSALATGAALSLLSVLPLASQAAPQTAFALSDWATLSGRLTNAAGQPVRSATIRFGAFGARTDGDGRFFVDARIPADGPLSFDVTDRDGAHLGHLQADPQRLRSGDRVSASLSLALAG